MKKKKGTTECDKSIVICDVDTAQCEDGTIKSGPTQDLGKLNYCLGLADAKAICRIQLSRQDVEDTLIWMHHKKGLFTVKFA